MARCCALQKPHRTRSLFAPGHPGRRLGPRAPELYASTKLSSPCRPRSLRTHTVPRSRTDNDRSNSVLRGRWPLRSCVKFSLFARSCAPEIPPARSRSFPIFLVAPRRSQKGHAMAAIQDSIPPLAGKKHRWKNSKPSRPPPPVSIPRKDARCASRRWSTFAEVKSVRFADAQSKFLLRARFDPIWRGAPQNENAAAPGAAVPIRPEAGCRYSSTDTRPRFEYAAPARPQIARGFAGARWYSRGPAVRHTPPSRSPPLPAPAPKTSAHAFESANRFDCIGEKSGAKAARESLRPATLQEHFQLGAARRIHRSPEDSNWQSGATCARAPV
jgi:hypothetical protein